MAEVAAHMTTSSATTSATLLLVDDEPAVLAAVRRTLTRVGYNVIAVADATRALDIMNATTVDVLIADLSMPGMSGAELIAATRRLHPQVVRVVLTGCGSIGDTEKIINDGEVHRFLTKPFKPATLRRVVEEALARKEELHRNTVASSTSSRRARLLADLEREHPGITHVERDDEGVYRLDRSRVQRLESALRGSALEGLGALMPSDRWTRRHPPA